MSNLGRYAQQLDELTVATLVTLLVISINAQVFSRLISKPITWLGDINLILFVWLIFLGFSIVWKKGEAIAMDNILGSMPEKYRFGIELFFEAVIAAFVLFLMHQSYYLAQSHAVFVTPALEWSRSIVTTALPVSMALIFIHSLIRIKKMMFDRLVKGKEF